MNHPRPLNFETCNYLKFCEVDLSYKTKFAHSVINFKLDIIQHYAEYAGKGNFTF